LQASGSDAVQCGKFKAFKSYAIIRPDDEVKVMKKLPTRAHGILDYIVGGAMMALPRMMGCSSSVTDLFAVAGGGAWVYSLMTKYELGALRVLPMKAHLAMDAISGAALISAGLMLKDEDAGVRAALVGAGAFEIAAAVMTETTSPVEMAERVGTAFPTH
jgi:hypothetical protein